MSCLTPVFFVKYLHKQYNFQLNISPLGSEAYYIFLRFIVIIPNPVIF